MNNGQSTVCSPPDSVALLLPRSQVKQMNGQFAAWAMGCSPRPSNPRYRRIACSAQPPVRRWTGRKPRSDRRRSGPRTLLLLRVPDCYVGDGPRRSAVDFALLPSYRYGILIQSAMSRACLMRGPQP
jgi:hypothetical protein